MFPDADNQQAANSMLGSSGSFQNLCEVRHEVTLDTVTIFKTTNFLVANFTHFNLGVKLQFHRQNSASNCNDIPNKVFFFFWWGEGGLL